jgi:hypothetical protein
MANKKKGTVSRPPQWWRHLREWKKVFWKTERATYKKIIKQDPDLP